EAKGGRYGGAGELVVDVEGAGRRRHGGVPAPARGGAGDGRAVVAAAAAGGALRAAGRARPAVPLPRRLRPGDGGTHGGGHRQAHVAGHLPQRAAPGARLLPLLEEDLRADVLDMVRADAAAHGGGPRARPRDLPHARGGVRPLRGAPHRPAARGRRARQPARRQVGPPPPRSRPRLLPRQPQRTDETHTALSLWPARLGQCAASDTAGEVEVDVAEWFQAVAEEAITRATFGRSYASGRVVFRMQGRLMAFASEAFRKVLVPGYRFLPTKKNRMSWGLDREIRRGLVQLIGRRSDAAEDHEAEIKEKGNSGGFRDLLGLMINARDKKSQAMPVEDMVEECKTFFFAGKQTTTNLLTWATVLLAMHPEWQDRARQEVLAVCGLGELPAKEHLHKLKTLGMILNETLRLYPPAVATIRRAKVDVTLGDLAIPRDTELLIPIMAIHHDARFWGPDAAQFNPGRFAGGAARAATHPLAFIPFGLGSRMCVGQNLALLEAKLTVAVLLQRFELRPSPKYVHAPTVLMLLHPQYGAPVIFRPLSSPPPSASVHTSDELSLSL
uniref:Cytochrome P450 734A1 n=1 Tax=Aegilops tauschii subsp. strangulata TaxID=200361 RepID=A0A453S9Y5_AEGTS